MSTLTQSCHVRKFRKSLKFETELRGYKGNGLAGFFVSGFVGTSLLWPDFEETRESISLNFKLGWEPIPKPVVNFDLKFTLFQGSVQ